MLRVLLSLALLAGLVAGCGRSDLPEHAVPVFKVGGALTHKGAPMGKAVITFHPTSPAPVSGKTKPPVVTATADDQGKYALSTYYTGDGAPEGQYTVTIYWPGERNTKVVTPGMEGDQPLAPDRLKMAHADAKTSKLKATVEKKENAIDFDLP